MAAALGENDAAIAYAREAVRRHDPLLVVFSVCARGKEPFCALPEVQELSAEVRLPALLK